MPGPPGATHGFADRPVRRTPAEHQYLGVTRGVVDAEIRDVDARHPRDPQSGHQLVVGVVVRDVAGAVGLLESADPVLATCGSRYRPVAREGVGMAGVGLVAGVVVARRPGEARIDTRQVVDIGDAPRFGSVGDRTVGQQHDRGAVGDRDARGFERGVEAVGGRLRSDDRDG